MEYRNSSGTHFSQDFAVGVGSSHGVELTGGSTGGTVRPASDDASAALNVQAKGASGILNLGTSTNGAVNIEGSAVASATPWSFTGSSFSVVGASSINLSPTSTASIRIGNSSNQTAVMITCSTMSIAGTSLACSAPVLFTGANVKVQGASSIVLSPTSTAGITIGNSSNENPILMTGSSIAFTSTHVNINSSRTVIGASTTPLILLQRSRIDFTVPALSSNAADNSVEVAVAGLTTNALCFIQQRQIYNSTVTAGLHVEGYCSTAGALRLNIYNLSVSSVSGSTMSADLFRIECPVAIP